MFIDLNGGGWNPEPAAVDDAEEAMLAVTIGEAPLTSLPGRDP